MKIQTFSLLPREAGQNSDLALMSGRTGTGSSYITIQPLGKQQIRDMEDLLALPVCSAPAHATGDVTADSSYAKNFFEEPEEEESYLFLLLYEQGQLLAIQKVILCPPFHPVIYCFVHPDYRQKGYFTLLLSHLTSIIKAEYGEFPVYTKEGKACAAAYDMEALDTEYHLIHSLNAAGREEHVKQLSPSVRLVHTTALQFAKIHCQCFGYSKEFSEAYTAQCMESGGELFLLISSEERTIGCCGLLMNAADKTDSCWLFGFGILPKYQRKHYGLHALWQIENYISQEKGQQSLSLQVSSTNEAAFSLYKKAGFREKASFTNYRYDICPVEG